MNRPGGHQQSRMPSMSRGSPACSPVNAVGCDAHQGRGPSSAAAPAWTQDLSGVPSGWHADECTERRAVTMGRVKRSGVADLPLHGGRVPAWLAGRMETLGTAISGSVLHHYGRAGAAVAPQRSVLVSGARLGDGDGLALVRHHDLGDGRAQARTEPAGPRARRLHLRRTRQAVAQHAATSCARSPIASASTATRSSAPAGSPRAWTTTPSPTASRSICTRSS